MLQLTFCNLHQIEIEIEIEISRIHGPARYSEINESESESDSSPDPKVPRIPNTRVRNSDTEPTSILSQPSPTKLPLHGIVTAQPLAAKYASQIYP